MGNNTGVMGGGRFDEQCKIVSVLDPVQKTATFGGALGIDRLKYNWVRVIISNTRTAGDWTLAVVHGDVAGTLTAPAAADLGLSDTPAAIDATGMQVVDIDCRKLKRYVGVELTDTGSGDAIFGIVAVLGANVESLPAA